MGVLSYIEEGKSSLHWEFGWFGWFGDFTLISGQHEGYGLIFQMRGFGSRSSGQVGWLTIGIS